MMQYDRIKVHTGSWLDHYRTTPLKIKRNITKLQNYDGNLSHLRNTKSPTVPVPVRKVFSPFSQV